MPRVGSAGRCLWLNHIERDIDKHTSISVEMSFDCKLLLLLQRTVDQRAVNRNRNRREGHQQHGHIVYIYMHAYMSISERVYADRSQLLLRSFSRSHEQNVPSFDRLVSR